MTVSPNVSAMARERRGARLDDLAGQQVRIHVDGPVLGKTFRDDRLAGRDSPRSRPIKYMAAMRSLGGMFELLTGTGLAVAAGLNAYIPMILIGPREPVPGLRSSSRRAGAGSRIPWYSSSWACCS